MNKDELIGRLLSYGVRVDHGGRRTLARFLTEYLTQMEVSKDDDPFGYHLPHIMADALEELRTGTDKYVVDYRQLFEKETGYNVPNITKVGEGDGLFRTSVVVWLEYIAKEITDDECSGNMVDRYLNAQLYVVQQAFDEFLRKVYRRGLFNLIKEGNNRGMSGTFGETELRSFVSAGRLMLTFARKQNDKNEIDVSFLAGDNNPQAYSAGVQSIHAGLPDCLAMINEVIEHWSIDKEKQTAIFKTASVGIGY